MRIQFIIMKPSAIIIFFGWVVMTKMTVTGYLTFDGESDGFQRTGIKREIQWKQFSAPVPIAKEVELFRKNVLYRRGEFGPLDASRQLELELECGAVGMSYSQGHSMRKQLLIKKSLTNADKLKNRIILKRLTKDFVNEHKSLLEMSRDMNIPPVSIFRAIISARLAKLYRKKERSRIVKGMVYECNRDSISEFLSDWEFQQMQLAKRNDIVGFAGHDIDSKEWENEVLAFLDNYSINYVAEDTLRRSDINSTPDCLVLDDLYINNQLIRWIEVKGYYASGLRENEYITKKSLLNQVKRYHFEFGTGAVIFKNGFSDRISKKLENTVLLDSGPLSDFTILP
eukprot:CCRYP_008969-RA/>CCRYP_008969-RA protein AED:0.37 eAED:0.37 QI:1095/1/1/1/1/1/2/115/340